MTRPEEDEAWRAIVENYGERPVLDDPDDRAAVESAEIDLTALDDPSQQPAPEPDPFDTSQFPSFDNVWTPPEPEEHEVVDRFVPPDPPVHIPSPPRLAAWLGLFGAPTLLLLAVVLGISLPGPITGALLIWFVVGFGYLVWHMPKGPTDPWDNGARV